MKKKQYLVIGMVLSYLFACSPSGNETNSSKDFSKLSDEKGFAEKHDEPKQLDFEPKGEMKTIEVSGGDDANIYEVTKSKENKYLIVIHEWWGLNNHILKEADILSDKLETVNVIALDLYDGKVATTREKAGEYMKEAEEDRIVSIIDAVLDYLPENAKVGTIGWCFGGGWSLRTAIQAEDRAIASVMYYGMPVEEQDQLKKLQTDVLFVYGKQDKWINEEVALNFEKNMDAVGKTLKVLAFDADHAFANPTSERYVDSAAQQANEASYSFLRERMN